MLLNPGAAVPFPARRLRWSDYKGSLRYLILATVLCFLEDLGKGDETAPRPLPLPKLRICQNYLIVK